MNDIIFVRYIFFLCIRLHSGLLSSIVNLNEGCENMSIAWLLNDPVNSYLYYLAGTTEKVLVAAPHHAPLDVSTLPCASHPTADENTGWITYELASRLNCSCLIAGNYFLDPNKYKTSDYFKKIEAVQPEILIEIHGHGSVSATFDIEISCGSREKSPLSQRMATQLATAFSNHPGLRHYTISGDFDQIHLRATKSLTINTNEWTAYHIELPFQLRKDPLQYKIMCDQLKNIILEMVSG